MYVTAMRFRSSDFRILLCRVDEVVMQAAPIILVSLSIVFPLTVCIITSNVAHTLAMTLQISFILSTCLVTGQIIDMLLSAYRPSVLGVAVATTLNCFIASLSSKLNRLEFLVFLR